LPFILFFFFFTSTKKEKPLWAIISFVFLTILSSYLEKYVPRKIIPIKVFYSITTFYEYSFFSYFIWSNINNKLVKRIILGITICFVVFLILFYTNSTSYKLDSIPIGVEAILILTFSSYFLYEQITNPNLLFIYSDYRFWIVTGIMIYLSGTFFIYIFANQIPDKELDLYWSFTFIFLGIMNILFSIGILVLGLQPTQKHHAKPKPKNHHYLDIT
jgi:hypothetical protein